jgi:hypothetical protein
LDHGCCAKNNEKRGDHAAPSPNLGTFHRNLGNCTRATRQQKSNVKFYRAAVSSSQRIRALNPQMARRARKKA